MKHAANPTDGTHPKGSRKCLVPQVAINEQDTLAAQSNGLGKQARIDAGMKALERSKGFIRSQLAGRLTIRKVPELIFLYDESLEKGNQIEKIIKEINQ